ncbi:MAG TPA: MaoC/PaaZ C-terminal domain-containing protein [Dehalococcoidia bacterium]|nr:MaoC/PaaZ C-terminal domain-containing protein [Dehalococcoidia bacterium]
MIDQQLMKADWSKVKEGDEYEFQVADVTRTHFVRYAGGGGDFNPIHHDQTFAEAAGLPTVFGMGMFTAGVLSRVPTEWFGATSVKRYAIRFNSRLWPGDTVTFKGRVVRVYEQDGMKHADLELSATNQKGENLIAGEATVRDWRP